MKCKCTPDITEMLDGKLIINTKSAYEIYPAKTSAGVALVVSAEKIQVVAEQIAGFPYFEEALDEQDDDELVGELYGLRCYLANLAKRVDQRVTEQRKKAEKRAAFNKELAADHEDDCYCSACMELRNAERTR